MGRTSLEKSIVLFDSCATTRRFKKFAIKTIANAQRKADEQKVDFIVLLRDWWERNDSLAFWERELKGGEKRQMLLSIQFTQRLHGMRPTIESIVNPSFAEPCRERSRNRRFRSFCFAIVTDG